MYHITVGKTPWCEWTGCQAGREVASKAGVDQCSYTTFLSARLAVEAIRAAGCQNAEVHEGECAIAAGVSREQRLQDAALEMAHMLDANLLAWEGEEDSVQEEHEDLIADLRALIAKIEGRTE